MGGTTNSKVGGVHALEGGGEGRFKTVKTLKFDNVGVYDLPTSCGGAARLRASIRVAPRIRKWEGSMHWKVGGGAGQDSKNTII